MMEKIVSLQNSRIKNINKLASKARERKEQGLFIIEGAREITLALEGGYLLNSVFVCPELFIKTDYPNILDTIDPLILFEVSSEIFNKIAYRESSDGLLALAQSKSHDIEKLSLPEKPFIIVLEAVEKPGNLGAILRTADAASVDAVIICNPHTDLYNPNVVRSSVGCLFTVQTAVCSNQEAFDFLKKKDVRTYAAELNAAEFYQNVDFQSASAIIMGTEADGLSDFWLQNSDARIKIPMRGKIDSLNVSVSTAILTFEAMRQRNFG
ncbi:MAG: RNA methyltransferase [Candidatus Azobacteroides sp.]|nr:RNA methyltransferase [Candidatus Azobacteroides sp.]